MNYKKGYIELIWETGYKKPVQAYIKKEFHGKIQSYHFFAEWDSFEEATAWLNHAHKYPIVINKQIAIGI
jgi:hypothetical protein